MEERERWDRRYRGRLGRVDAPPDPFVLRALEHVGPAEGRRALDLASGSGRHALELARRGWDVEAWDVSTEGLELLERRAAQRELCVRTRAIDVTAELLASAFALVVVVDFLDRALLGALAELVHPGGHAIVRTFTRAWPGEKPPERFRLAPEELARGLPGLETVLAEESGGRAGLLGRRPENLDRSC